MTDFYLSAGGQVILAYFTIFIQLVLHEIWKWEESRFDDTYL